MKPPLEKKVRRTYSEKTYSEARERRVHNLMNNFEPTAAQRRQLLDLPRLDESDRPEPGEVGILQRIKDRKARNAPNVNAIADFLDHIKGFYRGPPKQDLIDAQYACITRLHELNEEVAAATNREEFDRVMTEIEQRLLGFEVVSKQLLASVSTATAPFLDLIGRRSAPEPIREKKSKKKGKGGKEKPQRERPNPKPLAKTPATAAAVANMNGAAHQHGDEDEEMDYEEEELNEHPQTSITVATSVRRSQQLHHMNDSRLRHGSGHAAANGEANRDSDNEDGSSRGHSPTGFLSDPRDTPSTAKEHETKEESGGTEKKTPTRAKSKRSNNLSEKIGHDEEKRTSKRASNREGNQTTERPKREAAMAAASKKKEKGSGGSAKRNSRPARGGNSDNSPHDRPSSSKEAKEKDEETYCICNRISFGEMIGCDNEACEIEWFHFECIGLRVKPKGKWYCPDCRESEDNPRIPKAQHR